MFIKRCPKTKIYIYCEGKTEGNYFGALKRNNIISKYYKLETNNKQNDLNRAIEKSQRLEGIDIIVIYIYDSDTFNNKQKKINEKIEKQKKRIYFSEENFEDFLKCHKTKNIYRDKKPNLSRQLIEEIEHLDVDFIKKHIKKPNKFKDFKSIYDLLIELFEQKL